MVEPGPSVVKHNKESPPTSAEKRFASYDFTNVNPHITLDEVAGLVANATGRSKVSVYRDKGLKSDGKLVTTKKTREGKHLSEKRQLYEIHHS
jgi:hypothetical protein